MPDTALEVFFKGLIYTSLALAVGVATTRGLISQIEGSQRAPGEAVASDAILARLAIVFALCGLMALFGRSVAHTLTAFGLDELRWETWRTVAIESRWGQAWQITALSAAALALAAIAIQIHRRAGWWLFTVASVISLLSLPLLGHAASSALRFVLHGVHLIAVSSWLGSLAVIVLIRSRLDRTVERILSNFSSVALPAASLAIVTGATASIIYVQSPANLWGTAYGRTLLLKIGVFAMVVGCGWSNWRRARSGKLSQRRMLHAELMFALAVIAITSVLTELEHP